MSKIETNNPFGATERERQFYQKGVDAGEKHSQASPETKVFMTEITKITAVIQNDISYIKDELVCNKSEHREIMDKLDNFVQKTASKEELKKEVDDKADKWVEDKIKKYDTILTKIFITLLTTGLLAICGLLLQLYLFMNK